MNINDLKLTIGWEEATFLLAVLGEVRIEGALTAKPSLESIYQVSVHLSGGGGQDELHFLILLLQLALQHSDCTLYSVQNLKFFTQV